MEGGLICLAVTVGLLVIMATSLYSNARRQQTADAYVRLARRYGGTADPGSWLSRPTAQFAYAGSWVLVDVYSTGGKNPTYYTQVHFRGGHPTVRCEVYPEGMWSRVGKLLGMDDVQIGSPDFDDQYIIKGDDGNALRDLLSPTVQQQIERLRWFLGNGSIYVSFNSQELLVKKLSLIRDYSKLQELTELAIALFDQAVLTTQKGIDFVQNAAPPKITEAICQICGEKITSDVVFCRRCRTPHHLDCWQYYGACSTYGCRETRYLTPKSKRATRQRRKKDNA